MVTPGASSDDAGTPVMTGAVPSATATSRTRFVVLPAASEASIWTETVPTRTGAPDRGVCEEVVTPTLSASVAWAR